MAPALTPTTVLVVADSCPHNVPWVERIKKLQSYRFWTKIECTSVSTPSEAITAIRAFAESVDPQRPRKVLIVAPQHGRIPTACDQSCGLFQWSCGVVSSVESVLREAHGIAVTYNAVCFGISQATPDASRVKKNVGVSLGLPASV